MAVWEGSLCGFWRWRRSMMRITGGGLGVRTLDEREEEHQDAKLGAVPETFDSVFN